jgi:hypothetical protein
MLAHRMPMGCRDNRDFRNCDREVKLVFPHGDATTLLFGFDAQGEITGGGVMSMAGE